MTKKIYLSDDLVLYTETTTIRGLTPLDCVILDSMQAFLEQKRCDMKHATVCVFTYVWISQKCNWVLRDGAQPCWFCFLKLPVVDFIILTVKTSHICSVASPAFSIHANVNFGAFYNHHCQLRGRTTWSPIIAVIQNSEAQLKCNSRTWEDLVFPRRMERIHD